MLAFCSGIQAAAPVDSYVTPVPWAMPGYDSEVVMAAGAFVQGSSIELSADGPIRPPYAVYFQGGLTWYHAKLGILMSLQKLVEAGLAEVKENIQPLFLCAVKKKPLAVKRKPAKGDLRRNKLHIPHPVRRLRRIGLVRSVVPPFPTRIASLDSRGNPVPFAPLKTTKEEVIPLSWNHHPSEYRRWRNFLLCVQLLSACRG